MEERRSSTFWIWAKSATKPHFLRQGGRLYQLQAILEHSSIKVTCDVYGQLEASRVGVGGVL